MASHGCQGPPGQRLGSAKRGHLRPGRLIQRHRWRLLAHSAAAFWGTEGSRGLRAERVAPCGSRAGAATGFDVTRPGNPNRARATRTPSPARPPSQIDSYPAGAGGTSGAACLLNHAVWSTRLSVPGQYPPLHASDVGGRRGEGRAELLVLLRTLRRLPVGRGQTGQLSFWWPTSQNIHS